MKLEDMTFEQLADFLAGEVLKGLIAGNLRGAVMILIQTVIQWHGEKNG